MERRTLKRELQRRPGYWGLLNLFRLGRALSPKAPQVTRRRLRRSRPTYSEKKFQKAALPRLVGVHALAFLFCAAAAASAGTITGTVRAEGKAGADADVADGHYTSRKFKFVERVDYSSYHDFVVYVDQQLPEKVVVPATPLQIVVQKDATFLPHVLPLVVGTTVEWPNNDDIFHNAFSFSDAKPFDLGLYKDVVKQLTFDKPGEVDVFCSIHKSMHCVILVLQNNYFTMTDEKGHYSIPNVPAGTYHLKAWHERLPSQTQDITVPADGEVSADFVLGIKGLPQY